MNLKLIIQLSLFGLVMAIATVFWIPSSLEPIFWVTSFIVFSYVIAKNVDDKFFLHGFLLGLANCVWITSGHILLYTYYAANHVEEMKMISNMPLEGHPRLNMLITGPMIGIISGLVIGLFVFIASKIVKKKV